MIPFLVIAMTCFLGGYGCLEEKSLEGDTIIVDPKLAREGHGLFRAALDTTNSKGRPAAIPTFEKAMNTFNAAGHYDSAYLAGANIIGGYVMSYRFDQGIETFEQLSNKIPYRKSVGRAMACVNVGPCYAFLFQQYKAIDLLEEALEITTFLRKNNAKEKMDSIDIASALNNQGLYTYHIGVMVKAVGLDSMALKNFQLALKEMDSALAFFTNKDQLKQDSMQARVWGNQALVYQAWGKFDKATELNNKVVEIEQKYGRQVNEPILNARFNQAMVLFKQDRFDEAILEMEALESAYLKLGATGFDLVESYVRIGQAYAGRNQHYKALSYYQKALEHNSMDFSPGSYFENPKIEKVVLRIELIETLQAKINSLWEIIDKKNPIELKKLLPTYELVFDLLDKLKALSYSDTVRLMVGSYSNQLTDSYLRLVSKLGESEEQAFYRAEANRANVLLRGITQIQIKSIGGVIDSVWNLESELDNRINTLKNFSFVYNRYVPGSPQATYYQDQIDQAYRAKDSLARVVKNEYLKYYRFRYEDDIPSIQYIQEHLLVDDQIMVEYFLGEKELYTFIVSEKGLSMMAQSRDSISDWIDLMITQASKTGSPKFTFPARQLYQKLLEPVLTERKYSRIIIIPDGILSYIPFGMLLSEDVNGKDYMQFPFAIKEHAFMYEYSAATLSRQIAQDLHEKAPRKDFLGVAPGLENLVGKTVKWGRKRFSFPSIIFNRKEVEEIPISNKKVFIGSGATLDSLLAHLEDYKIVHIASHAVADNEFPDSSLIFFEGQPFSVLCLGNFPDVSLRTEMIVISSCQSATGTVLAGEGVASLSRGFILRGVKSIVATQWSMDDLATFDLMIKFYESLMAGIPKDLALQNAKIMTLNRQLRNSKLNFSHPFFWAAFTAYGSYRPLEIAKK
ncbi:MAG: CHAT domain-containing protein [Bacteroidetes bacterium]|nr:CHAT domain-containing protein [Bacteroidota bacterium]